MVEAIVRRAHELGFNEIWVALHHEAAQIRTHIDTLRHEGITCQYIIEEVPLGTIGAVSRLPETAQREGVVVCNADIVQSVNFQELADRHADSEAAMTLGVVEHTVAVPFAASRSS
jgi:NDP-sugar pyrophosphorylase family protein